MTAGSARGSVFLLAALACASPVEDGAPVFGPELGPAGTSRSNGQSGFNDGAPGLGLVSEGGDAGATLERTCGGTVFEPERLPLDLYFLVDSSGSMAEGAGGGATKWEVMSGALIDFLGAPENSGVGVGVGYFPENVLPTCAAGSPDCLCIPVIDVCFANVGGSCTAVDYATPAVPLSLPPAPSDVIASIGARQLAGGTPTRAALEGTYAYLETWARQNPGRKLATIVATDGEPTGCVGNSPEEAARLAARALAGPSPVETFVIGVGGSLADLDQVARAGGTSSAFLIDAAQNLAEGFAEALESIRRAAGPCAFQIPEASETGPVDPARVNVRFTPAGAAAPVLVGKTSDGTASSCGGDGGWYYDDPAAPTRIQLCGATCEGTLEARVDVQFGCESIVQLPR